MPQPNKGSAGKAHVAAPIKGAPGSKTKDGDKIAKGIHVPGIKGKGNK
jgi:hypothetical protein